MAVVPFDDGELPLDCFLLEEGELEDSEGPNAFSLASSRIPVCALQVSQLPSCSLATSPPESVTRRVRAQRRGRTRREVVSGASIGLQAEDVLANESLLEGETLWLEVRAGHVWLVSWCESSEAATGTLTSS